MNLNEKLNQAAKAWAIKKDYSRAALPEVLALNKEYRAANPKEYGYNSAIREYILARHEIAPALVDTLETEIYLSQHDIENEKKADNQSQMIKAGWRLLDKEAINTALWAGKNLQVSATSSFDWLTVKIDNIYKPHIFSTGEHGLMKLGARSRGYLLRQFENAFCKFV